MANRRITFRMDEVKKLLEEVAKWTDSEKKQIILEKLRKAEVR